ncbi:MAG: cytochrome b/b6 domain-containing protein [Burkholderiales bacterium]|nr:cytochrome b/b6 domain-containing protein [Burkholderiales bacterium]
MQRYHPAQVALHWLSAVLIVSALAMGTLSLKHIPNAEAVQKVLALKAHMALGLAIAFVVTLRIALRFALVQPPRATSGNRWLDLLARVVHAALYMVVLAMAASGLALAVQAGLPAIVFRGSGTPLPESFWDYAPRAVHGALAKALIALVALHAVAALYHQLVRRDGLMRRMWFGARGA